MRTWCLHHTPNAAGRKRLRSRAPSTSRASSTRVTSDICNIANERCLVAVVGTGLVIASIMQHRNKPTDASVLAAWALSGRSRGLAFAYQRLLYADCRRLGLGCTLCMSWQSSAVAFAGVALAGRYDVVAARLGDPRQSSFIHDCVVGENAIEFWKRICCSRILVACRSDRDQKCRMGLCYLV